MKDTIDEISEELWLQIIEAMEMKFLEFGIPNDRDDVRVEIASRIVTKLENNVIVES